MSDLCARCKTETPRNGYICEWCTAEEYRRIGRVPGHLVRPALDSFDVEKYGFVRPYKTPMEQFAEATEEMKKDLRKLGVDVELPDDA